MPHTLAARDAADILWFSTNPRRWKISGHGGWCAACHTGLPQPDRTAADELGYFGVLLPTGRSCEDSWVIASAMVPLTTKLRFLVAVRPGLSEPSMTARMAATLDRLSGGPGSDQCGCRW